MNKRCGGCKNYIPTNNFWTSYKSRDGFQSMCKACHKARRPPRIPIDTNELFIDLITKKRIEGDYSMTDVAKAIGVTEVTIHYIETRKIKSIKLDNAIKLATFFDIDLNSLKCPLPIATKKTSEAPGILMKGLSNLGSLSL